MSHIQGLSIVLLVVIVVATHFTVGKTLEYPNPIHHLRPHPGSGGHRIHNVNCLSWRFAIEANNIQTWKTVPKKCEDYVGHYMLGAQYKEDCSIVANAAISYVKGLNISKGKDIWVFDIDETSLSNLPYHARPSVGFGALPYNETGFNKWQEQASAPAIQSVLNLYNTLIQIGVKVVFLSGSSDVFREPKSRNMINIGYHTWFKMILKQPNETHMKSVEYKSMHRAMLENLGYQIIGNIGDQWSDLLGSNPGLRTFKLPDPMYYIA